MRFSFASEKLSYMIAFVKTEISFVVNLITAS